MSEQKHSPLPWVWRWIDDLGERSGDIEILNEATQSRAATCEESVGFNHAANAALIVERVNAHVALKAQRDEAQRARLALESDMGVLRAELAMLMDVVSELDDAMLERIPAGKLLKALRSCSEAEKHELYESKVDSLTAQRDDLLAFVEPIASGKRWTGLQQDARALLARIRAGNAGEVR